MFDLFVFMKFTVSELCFYLKLLFTLPLLELLTVLILLDISVGNVYIFLRSIIESIYSFNILAEGGLY